MTFEYHASTANDPEIREAFPDCWSEAGRSHLHPSWRDFRDARLEPQGEDLWTATLDDVPVGREQLVYLADRNTCSADNPHGTVTTDLSANGVLLVRIVEMDVHGGPKQNLAFTLSSDGTVSP